MEGRAEHRVQGQSHQRAAPASPGVGQQRETAGRPLQTRRGEPTGFKTGPSDDQRPADTTRPERGRAQEIPEAADSGPTGTALFSSL